MVASEKEKRGQKRTAGVMSDQPSVTKTKKVSSGVLMSSSKAVASKEQLKRAAKKRKLVASPSASSSSSSSSSTTTDQSGEDSDYDSATKVHINRKLKSRIDSDQRAINAYKSIYETIKANKKVVAENKRRAVQESSTKPVSKSPQVGKSKSKSTEPVSRASSVKTETVNKSGPSSSSSGPTKRTKSPSPVSNKPCSSKGVFNII